MKTQKASCALNTTLPPWKFRKSISGSKFDRWGERFKSHTEIQKLKSQKQRGTGVSSQCRFWGRRVSPPQTLTIEATMSKPKPLRPRTSLSTSSREKKESRKTLREWKSSALLTSLFSSSLTFNPSAQHQRAFPTAVRRPLPFGSQDAFVALLGNLCMPSLLLSLFAACLCIDCMNLFVDVEKNAFFFSYKWLLYTFGA